MSKLALAAFVICANPTIVWPVRVSLPSSGGGSTEFAFEATFKVLSEEDYETQLAPSKSEETEGEEKKGRSIRNILDENARILPALVEGWTVKNAQGADIPISDLPKTLKGPYGRALSVGFYRAINEIRYGIDLNTDSASLGNSKASPADGAAEATAVTAAT